MASSTRIDELRKKFDENPRRYFAPLANEYRKAGDIEQAITICREYLPQQPGHMSGHIVFGQALYEAKQYEEAKAVFETALTLDPENLIALRHLGDISLVLSDNDGARTWYRRVLEADPRNEEIQAQLGKLEQAASQAPTPVIGAHAVENTAPVASPAPAKSAPSGSAPTVVMSAVPRPGTAAPAPAPPPPPPPPTSPAPPAPPADAPVTATSPTAEIVLEDIVPAAPAESPVEDSSAPETIEIESTSFGTGTPAPDTSSPAALEGLESTSATSDAPPMDSFSLDGLETTSLSAPPESTSPEPVPDLDLGGLGGEEPAQTPSSETIAASAPAEPPSSSPAADTLDLDLGALGQPAEVSSSTETSAPEVPAASEPDLALSDLAEEASSQAAPEFEIALSSEPVEAAATAETSRSDAPVDLDLDLPPSAPEQEAAAGGDIEVTSPEPVIEATAPAPAAVELPLVEPSAPSEPDIVDVAPETEPESSPFVTETMAELYLQQGHRDEALKVYRALLEQRPSDAGLRAKIDALGNPESTPVASGPTIGDVLRFVALRKPGFRPEPAASNGAQHPPDSTASLAGDDALAGRFSFPDPSDSDERAAVALAQAFAHTGAAGDASVSGASARPASNELTLDSVFGSQPQDTPPPNFSFDQFFSQRASAEHPAPAAAAPEAGEGESAQDVAQFSQWLDGLKQQ